MLVSESEVDSLIFLVFKLRAELASLRAIAQAALDACGDMEQALKAIASEEQEKQG